MLKTFLFDMGNVLVHFSHDRMCSQIGALCGLTGDEIRMLLMGGALQWRFERGHVTREEFHAEFQRQTGKKVDIDALHHAGSDIFTLNEPIVPVLDGLKAQGYRLVLLSNTSVAHFEFVRSNFDVLKRFDDTVLSCEVGAMKPDAPIYEAALQKIACAPAECFYTDDIPEYVAAGRTFGLQAEVFVDAPTLIEQLKQRDILLSAA